MNITEKKYTLVGQELIIPDSVIALASIVGFWQPQMGPDYRKESASPEEKPQKTLASAVKWLERRARGQVWKQVNAEITHLQLPKTKANRRAVYSRLTQEKKTGRIEG